MFLKLDSIFRQIRRTNRDESGASLVLVVALMAVGFIVSAMIASACLFAVQQTSQNRSNVQAFAAAEAGRDAAVSVLSQQQAAQLCTNSAAGVGHFKSAVGQSPAYEAWVQAVDSGTPPTGWQGAVGSGDVPAVPSCPSDGTKYIVVRSIGSSAGGREVIDAVYKWQLGKETVAGGGLGYQGVSYSAAASTIKGDMIVKNGNLECNYGTVFDGSVYVLNGNVVVGTDALFGLGDDACTINGELVVAGTINFVKKCNGIELFGVCLGTLTFGTMNVGGPAHVQGNLDLTDGGALKVGTDPIADNPSINDVEADYTTRDLTVAGHINATATTITTSNGGNIEAVEYITAGKPLTAAGGIATGGDLTATATIEAKGGDISAVGKITSSNSSTVKASASMVAGGNIEGSGVRTATNGRVTTTGAIGGSVTVTAGGAVKAVGSISTSGKVDANGGDVQTGGALNGGEREASGSITTTQAISTSTKLTAGGNIVTNGALTINGSSNTATAGGTISVNGNLSGDGAALANGKLTVKGSISGNGARQALGGALWGDNSGNLSGNGAKTAKYIFVNGNLASGGAVTASENLIVNGSVSSNINLNATSGTLSINGTPGTGTKTGGTVLIQGNVSGGAVTATTGDIDITGDVTGGGALSAANGRIDVSGSIGTSTVATTGALSAKTGISVNGLINLSGAGITTTGTGASVTATNGDIKTTTATSCDIKGDLHAGGILYLPQSGSSNPFCSVTGKVVSASTSKSTLAGSNWRLRVGTTASSTVQSAASTSTGWGTASGGTARYIKGATTATQGNGNPPSNTTTPTLNGSTTKPLAPNVAAALTAPVNGTMNSTSTGEQALTAVSPTDVTTPSAPIFVLNERTTKTWSDIADLQLRTTWLDLGTYTDWGPTYYPVTLSGTRCTSWLGIGGQLTRILNTAGEVRDIATGAVLVPASAQNVVIDATACNNPITMTWAATNLKRDAVILVNNVSFDLASMGSQSAVHQLFVVQVDKNPNPQLSPRGVVEPVPNCSPGQNRISINGDGIFGSGTYKARVLLYTPCGVSGGWVNNWAGHIYASGSASVDTNVLSTYTCVDMSIPLVISLPCDIDTITDTGHMNVAAYAVGDRLYQTEP